MQVNIFLYIDYMTYHLYRVSRYKSMIFIKKKKMDKEVMQ